MKFTARIDYESTEQDGFKLNAYDTIQADNLIQLAMQISMALLSIQRMLHEKEIQNERFKNRHGDDDIPF